MTTLTVPARFCGPPASGNGGWVAGALAALVPDVAPTAPVTVTLRRPPPLDTPLVVVTADGTTTLTHDGDEVASATPAAAAPSPAAAVPADVARAAEAAYPGLTHHGFDTCFGCGTARGAGDGLRIFPGPVADLRVAATWTPGDPTTSDVGATWSALDCISAWAVGIGERAMVLGRMTASLASLPAPGVEHVVVGEGRGEDGRKIRTAATLYDDAGAIVGTAEHTWITVDAESFGWAASA
ncbi:hypothetical protein [Nocardioides sp. CFH 31398]|uniref:hypothetical protein n=1 Tax=Nocardioides sp. CFH 31398 TaxID=2919579 RepID=UPI001F0556A4|nr:hypothetical protein [Nocardioides sp. CFH 31398]MCH1865269.1 hypothetical protein [Nocardioides sp. CFH 31398]